MTNISAAIFTHNLSYRCRFSDDFRSAAVPNCILSAGLLLWLIYLLLSLPITCLTDAVFLMISDQLQSLTVFSVLALFVTLIIFFGRMCFGWFKGLSPIHYKVGRCLLTTPLFFSSLNRTHLALQLSTCPFTCSLSSSHLLKNLTRLESWYCFPGLNANSKYYWPVGPGTPSIYWSFFRFFSKSMRFIYFSFKTNLRRAQH